MDTPLLCVRELTVSVRRRDARVRALDGVSFDVPRAAAVALVGESGSGKSLAALAILRLLSEPDAKLDSGEVIFDGTDLAKLEERQLCSYRGRRIAMVLQEPARTLDPVTTIGAQLAEIVRLRHGVSRSAARARAVEALDRVGIASSELFARAHPHQLSSGMRQRVLVAMALACEPELLVADEPTSLVDVGVGAQIVDLLRRRSDEHGMSALLLTQSLGVALELAKHVVVLYAGSVVEQGAIADVAAAPLHPHTEQLLGRGTARAKPFAPAPPGACRFAGRCAYVRDLCLERAPTLEPNAPGRSARCHFAGAWA